jgi:hypothetical protein
MHLGDSSNARSRGNFRRDLANRRNERFRSVLQGPKVPRDDAAQTRVGARRFQRVDGRALLPAGEVQLTRSRISRTSPTTIDRAEN